MIKKYIKDHDKYKHSTIEEKYLNINSGRLKVNSVEEREQWLRFILIIDDVAIRRESLAKLIANEAFFESWKIPSSRIYLN